MSASLNISLSTSWPSRHAMTNTSVTGQLEPVDLHPNDQFRFLATRSLYLHQATVGCSINHPVRLNTLPLERSDLTTALQLPLLATTALKLGKYVRRQLELDNLAPLRF